MSSLSSFATSRGSSGHGAPHESTAEQSRSLSGSAPEGFSVDHQVQMLWHLLDRSYAGVFWKDIEGRFLGSNNMFLDLLGVDSLDDIVGKTDLDFFEPSKASEYQAADAHVMETGEPIYDIYETVRKTDGTVETLQTSKMPVRDPSGEIVAMMGCFSIVTGAVQTEQELRTLQERFALALDTSRDGMWEYEIDSQDFDVSQRFLELFELDLAPDKTLSTSQAEQTLGLTQDEIIAAVALMSSDELTMLTAQRSHVMADGSSRWFDITGFPFRAQGDVITHMIGSVADVTDQVHREQTLLQHATHDYLTGLPNRRALLEHLDTLLGANVRTSVLYLDLDDFKVINDSLGHQAGDELLQLVSERLRGLLSDDQMLARLGGDEFAIVARDHDADSAVELGQQVVDALAEPLTLGQAEMYLTSSVGVVHSQGQHATSLEILRDGDIALYSAKRAGKDQVHKFEPKMAIDADAKLEMQNDVRRAVIEEEFTLHYQPIVNADGSMHGVEALLRWPREGLETLRPESFLGYLENTSLIVAVGERVIHQAMSQLVAWRQQYAEANDMVMSLNVSRVQFQSSQVCETVIGALEQHGLAPHDVILELTETAITDNFEAMAATLTRVRDLGIRIAIDDFGVGQSSLGALYELPVDIVKLDRRFVSRVESESAEPVIDAVLAIARSVGLQTTAEGVETTTQRDYLAKAGCDYLQGYFFGHALAPEDLAAQFFDKR